MRAEAAHGAFLDRHHHIVAAHQFLDQRGVERLGEPHIRNRGRQPLGFEQVGCLLGFFKPCAK